MALQRIKPSTSPAGRSCHMEEEKAWFTHILRLQGQQ